MDDTGVLNIAMAVLGIAALFWAFFNNQFTNSQAVGADPLNDADTASSTAPASPIKRAIFVLVIIFVFVSLLASVALTVKLAGDAAKNDPVKGPADNF